MRAGKLNDRIMIQRQSSVRDAAGQPKNVWSDVLPKVWADVRFRSGLSAIKSDSDVSVAKASIRIRIRADVNAGMRVVFKTQVFDIKSVLPADDPACVDLVCEVVR